jgi:hypothetical protein
MWKHPPCKRGLGECKARELKKVKTQGKRSFNLVIEVGA